MREYFRSLKFVLVIVIIAFLATSVVYFGSSAMSGGTKHNVIASVNGEEIPAERFRRGQANLLQVYERASRQKLTPEQAERMGLNQQVIRDLVRDALTVQAAQREGIRVPDDELRKRIQDLKEFQVDGRFSRDQYMRILRMAKFEPAEFETEMRRQIMRERMEGLITSGAKVSDAELREAYALFNGKVRAEWASLDAQPLMAGINVSDSELEPYLKSHQAQFTQPERRKIEYVLVSSAMTPQSISDKDAEAYYKEHGAEFEQPQARPCGPRARSRAPGGRQRRGEQRQGQGRGGDQAGQVRRGLREDRQGGLGGHRQRRHRG